LLTCVQIYFVGVDAKKVNASLDSEPKNHGFDDDEALYIYAVHDHIAYRYEILKVITFISDLVYQSITLNK